MKLQLLSDFHNEFYRHSGAPDIADSDADVVILAGDIDVGIHGFTWAISEAQRLDKPIIYIAGNHEFYHHDLALLKDLRQIAAGNEHVHFLENDQIVIGEVRFLGCTLWTDYSAAGNPVLAMVDVQQRLNDHRLIRNGHQLFLPSDALTLHQQSRAWLEQQLAQPFPGKTVVITHHGPHPSCHDSRYPLDSLASAFWSDLGELVEMADVWCFGHTHSNLDVQVGRCHLIANQRGYADEDVGDYHADLVVRLI